MSKFVTVGLMIVVLISTGPTPNDAKSQSLLKLTNEVQARSLGSLARKSVLIILLKTLIAKLLVLKKIAFLTFAWQFAKKYAYPAVGQLLELAVWKLGVIFFVIKHKLETLGLWNKPAEVFSHGRPPMGYNPHHMYAY